MTGSWVGITLKKTEPLTYSIPFVNVLESGYNSWSGYLWDSFEDIITSGNNDPAWKTGWFQSRVLVCIYYARNNFDIGNMPDWLFKRLQPK